MAMYGQKSRIKFNFFFISNYNINVNAIDISNELIIIPITPIVLPAFKIELSGSKPFAFPPFTLDTIPNIIPTICTTERPINTLRTKM